MSTPAAKRLRTDTARTTLLKPFRSPFKHGATPNHDREPEAPDTHTKRSLDRHDGISESLQTHKSGVTSGLPAVHKPVLARPSNTALNSDPDLVSLLKCQRELERQLRELKEELDVAEQARKIETTSEGMGPTGVVDGELVELINKWKTTSRQAAEELYSSVRDRVNRLGGPRAWQEMQKNQEEFRNGFDEVNRKKRDDEGSESGENHDLYTDYDIDPDSDRSDRSRVGGDRNTEAEEKEDEFTIAMMLKFLNVDLDMIGFDREQQRWAD